MPKPLRRPHRMVLYLTTEELKELQDTAFHAGADQPSVWVRMAALQVARNSELDRLRRIEAAAIAYVEGDSTGWARLLAALEGKDADA